MTTLRTYIDFKSPGAYLALAPTTALAQRRGVEIDWQPLRTRQQAVPEEKPDEDRGTTHRRVRAIARRDTHLLYARLAGLPMVYPHGEFAGTDLALAVLDLLTEHKLPFIEAAFSAYWVDGADLNNHDVVAAIIRRVDGHDSVLNILDVDSILRQCAARALDDGVIDTPGYVVAEQVFVGREHLPWIEELLQGAKA